MINISFGNKNNLLKFFLGILILVICLFLYISYTKTFDHNLVVITPDDHFVKLIKQMAQKNQANPDLYLKAYNSAQTEEERLHKFITKQFYDCVIQNDEQIHTKAQLNKICGHFIKF